jgi:carbon monoxide dehydrogenase subunit G
VTTRVEISSRIVVPATPEHVWQAVVDWAGQHRWMLGTRVHGGHGLGATVVARTGIGPLGFTDTMVVSEWDPPRRCVVRHTGRVVRGAGIFEVAPSGAGAEFRWAEQLDLPLTGAIQRLGWPVVRPLAQRGMDASLRRFARLVAPTR